MGCNEIRRFSVRYEFLKLKKKNLFLVQNTAVERWTELQAE